MKGVMLNLLLFFLVIFLIHPPMKIEASGMDSNKPERNNMKVLGGGGRRQRGDVDENVDDAEDEDEDGEDDNEDQCGLYLAMSSTSTPKEPKWGFFAGKDIDAKHPIGYGDVAIHTFHLMANNIYSDPKTGEPVDDLDINSKANLVDWLEQFVWVPHASGGQFELDGEGARIITAVPGGGVLGGYNPKMTNSDWNHSSAYHREAWNEYPGVSHPGRGAYSNYYNLELASIEDIPAGKEIFLNYGDNWEGEKDAEEDLLTKKDYKKVDQTIKKIMDFFDKYEGDLDDNSKKEIYSFFVNDVLSAAAGTKKGKQISKMLPEDPSGLKGVLESGGTFYLSSPTAVRTPEWLQTNGRCMDNIRPGPSTIPYAGRGAFATRDMKAGQMVAPAPLLQIPDEDILDMYQVKPVEVQPDDKDDEGPEIMAIRDSDEPFSQQLLYNYVYGHRDSTLVFLPVGAVVNYINHSKEKANAKLVWSDHPNNHKDWFQLNPDVLIDDDHSYLGLLMEIVATKDIAAGEEIFLDYGDEWQAAWDEHVVEFEKEKREKWPITALDLNQEYKTKLIKTIDEEPYPDNVMIKCFLMVKKPEEDQPQLDEKGRKIRIWSEADSGKPNIVSDNLFDCDIVASSETTEGRYYDVEWSNGKSKTLVQKVPHKAVVFLDKPGTGDQHFVGFRHYIGIPDDIFPEGPWRNSVTELRT